MLLSLVVPCYNENAALPPFMAEVQRVAIELEAGGVRVELVFIDDGSSDATLQVMQQLAAQHTWVRYYSFSRNFGKESAILAGLEQARGDYVAVMDADLQDPPALLPQMLHAVLREGYDCVGTRRVTRKGEPPIRSFFARMFYRVINSISETKLVDGARDYRMLSRKAVQALLAMPECNRFSKGLYEWIGFRTKWLEYENKQRVAGETKWSFWKLFKYALEGIIAFSTAPLALASLLGGCFVLIALGMILTFVIRDFLWHITATGWDFSICAMLFVSGIQLFCLGIFGQYLAKAYKEVKHRPHYIIARSSDSISSGDTDNLCDEEIHLSLFNPAIDLQDGGKRGEPHIQNRATGKLAWQSVRFVLVGLVATLVHWGIYTLIKVLCHLNDSDELGLSIAYSIGYAISLAGNYWLSLHYTFRTQGSLGKGLGFVFSHAVNYVLHIALLNLFLWAGVGQILARVMRYVVPELVKEMPLLGDPAVLVPLPVLVVVVPINFFFVRFFLTRGVKDVQGGGTS